jgi:hypothetical protein
MAQLSIFDELLRVQTAPECRYCNGTMTPAPSRRENSRVYPFWAQSIWECSKNAHHLGLLKFMPSGFFPANHYCKIHFDGFLIEWSKNDGAKWEFDQDSNFKCIDIGKYMKRPDCLFLPTCRCGTQMKEAALGLWFCPKHTTSSITIYAGSICYYTPERCCKKHGHTTPMPRYSGVDSI